MVRRGNLPQPSIHSSCSSRDNLGDEDPRIIRDVGIVYSSSNAKAQARVPLHTGYDWHFKWGTINNTHSYLDVSVGLNVGSRSVQYHS